MRLEGAPFERIRVILVRPASPGNVGSVARAMMNFGLSRLMLVELPTFEDPAYFDLESRKLAWRAGGILEAAERCDSLGEALRGTTLALGASPRALRGSAVHTPREAASALAASADAGGEVGLVFGGEADGLRNEELSALAGIVTIPTGEAYPELNLAQAAVVCCYELFLATAGPFESAPAAGDDAPAPFEEVEPLFESARRLLVDASYLKLGSEYLAHELRRFLARARMSRREANLFRGILRQLAWAIRRADGAGEEGRGAGLSPI